MNFDILASKLSTQFGFSVSATKFITSYLTGRSALICSNNQISRPVAIKSGVPQGSILGPLLFCMYTNDFSTSLNYMQCHSYADDTQVYISGKVSDLVSICSKTNEDLSRIYGWAVINQLKINSLKTQCLILSRRQLINIPSIFMNGIEINPQPVVKNLGIVISAKLEWTPNVQTICRSIIIGLRSLYQFALSLPQEIKLKLVQALFIPYILNNDVVMGELSVAEIRTLEKACNSVTRFVYGLRKYDHISHVSSNFLGMSLKMFLRYRRCVFLFNLIHTKEPKYLYDKLKLSNSIRLSTNLIPNVCRSVSYSKSFFVHDIHVWNSLPVTLRNCKSLEIFKRNSFNYFKSIH